MLENPAYIGQCVYNRRTLSKWHRYREGSSIERQDEGAEKRPESDWIVTPDAWPALVDADTFQQVQDRLAETRRGAVHQPDQSCLGTLRGGSQPMSSRRARKALPGDAESEVEFTSVRSVISRRLPYPAGLALGTRWVARTQADTAGCVADTSGLIALHRFADRPTLGNPRALPLARCKMNFFFAMHRKTLALGLARRYILSLQQPRVLFQEAGEPMKTEQQTTRLLERASCVSLFGIPALTALPAGSAGQAHRYRCANTRAQQDTGAVSIGWLGGIAARRPIG